MQAWDNNTLHPVMISECWGMLSALQREKGSSESSNYARKSLVVSTNVYRCLSLFGMYELWKKAGRIFLLFSCTDLRQVFRTANFLQFPYFSEKKQVLQGTEFRQSTSLSGWIKRMGMLLTQVLNCPTFLKLDVQVSCLKLPLRPSWMFPLPKCSGWCLHGLAASAVDEELYLRKR